MQKFELEGLFDFLNKGVSAFHSAAAAAAILEANGYEERPESAAWELVPGGKYYTTRNGSAVLAWRMPKGELTGWHVTASHSDSPTWKIKELDGGKDAVFARAETEGYAGPSPERGGPHPCPDGERREEHSRPSGPCAGLHPEPLHSL